MSGIHRNIYVYTTFVNEQMFFFGKYWQKFRKLFDYSAADIFGERQGGLGSFRKVQEAIGGTYYTSVHITMYIFVHLYMNEFYSV